MRALRRPRRAGAHRQSGCADAGGRNIRRVAENEVERPLAVAGGSSQRIASGAHDLGLALRPRRGSRGSPRARAAPTPRTSRTRAPRDSASMPSAPEPANRSSTRRPSMAPRIEKSASRTRSAVGRVPGPARRAQPAALVPPPATILIMRLMPESGPARTRSVPPLPRAGARSPAARARGRRPARSAARSRARSSRSTSSGSRATRNSGRPCWRVPSTSPAPAQLQVDLGELEAVALASRSPRAAAATGRRTGCRATRARRGRSARAAGGAARSRSARPPRSSSPSAFGTSMPTSITLVATSTSASPAANAAIASCFRLVRICPWISSTRWSRNSVARQPLGLGGRRLRLQRLGLLDERADDEALAPLRDLLADPLVRAGARAGAVDGVRLDRLAPGRQLAQDRHVEVAVGGQRERARDRRRGHVQRVRRRGRRCPSRRARRAGARRTGAARRPPRARARGTRPSARSARGCRRSSRARPTRAARAARAAAPPASTRSAARSARGRRAAGRASPCAARRASRWAP